MMIAKFSTAEDLMAHYATVRARLHGPALRVAVTLTLPEPEPEPVEPVAPEAPIGTMTVEPVHPDFIRVNFDEVVALVCKHLGYERRGIFADRRMQKLCFDRQLLWALAYRHCPHLSLPQIGRASGGKDHTTVLHGRKRGVNHPDYETLSQALQNLYEEKMRVNAALIEQDQNRFAFLPMPV